MDSRQGRRMHGSAAADGANGCFSGCWSGTLRRPARERGNTCIIVGAGPAGLSAAKAVLDSGGRPLLLERGRRCGRRRGGDAHGARARSGSIGSASSFGGQPLSAGDDAVDELLSFVGGSDRAKIITGACVTGLIISNAGTCVGCQYVASNGVVHEERGPVIMCSGGFCADQSANSLLARYRPDLLHLPTACKEQSTGELLRLAMSIGAQGIDMEKVQLTPLALIRVGDEEAKVKVSAPDALLSGGGLLLNPLGDRFCDETGNHDDIAAFMWNAHERFFFVIPEIVASVEAQCLLRRYVRTGLARRHCDVASLCKDCGMNAAKVKAALESRYRAEMSRDMLSAVAEGAVFAANVVPAVRCCVGGLRTDSDGAVLRSDGRPIAGLFAAGEAAAADRAADAMTRCMTSGHVAGTACSRMKARNASVCRVHTIEDIPAVAADAEGAATSEVATHGRASHEASDEDDISSIERFLESYLNENTLCAALAEAHKQGGSLDFVAETLRHAFLSQRDVGESRCVNIRVHDRGLPRGGCNLPTPVHHARLADVCGTATVVEAACVHCRLPLPLEVLEAPLDYEVASPDAKLNGDQNCAYATLLYGDKLEYFLGALVTGWSLKSTGSTITRLLLHTADVPKEFLSVLTQFWCLREVDYLEGCSNLYKNYANSRFKAVFTKLQALSCTDFDKVLMLDLDMLIRVNIDELFELKTPAAMKRSSGREQPPHGGTFGASDLWRQYRDDMCSGINAGVMLLQPSRNVYQRMLQEIADPHHPEHLGTFGPEQDYLARFYCAFEGGRWTHIHPKFNYQLMLPDDYVSSAYRSLSLQRDVAVAHYSGPRVKPWELEHGRPLGIDGLRRLLQDDSVRSSFARERRPQQSQTRAGNRPRERIMDGVLIVENDSAPALPESVQEVMCEWVAALRTCAAHLRRKGIDLEEVAQRQLQS
eukprot:TRINITY_DN19954_c0_g2_i1.p1 TRINITY_DN19954_c0_g2~~TRINITY_DN19954_c0_g2_i1.p1  ORF type:complete len:937 (+),score=125.99 TRINITY_DN19954_c0_g2_i1:87-2897(+)